jgi:hypothetical protein
VGLSGVTLSKKEPIGQISEFEVFSYKLSSVNHGNAFMIPFIGSLLRKNRKPVKEAGDIRRIHVFVAENGDTHDDCVLPAKLSYCAL